MTNSDRIKTLVRGFQAETGFGGCEADCFPPWWIKNKFRTSAEDATGNSSDGNHDLGIDGFHLSKNGNNYHLSLVQAKYTSDLQQIRRGVSDLVRFIPVLANLLARKESDAPIENRVIRILRARLNDLEWSTIEQFDVTGFVISLSIDDQEILDHRCESARTEFEKTFSKLISDPKISADLKILTASDVIPDASMVTRAPAPAVIYFSGSEEVVMEDSVFLSGIGRLSDLVNMYEKLGNSLFAKNVRLFLYGKKNEAIGPAGKIKETLTAIAEGTASPRKFAFLHNGITIYAKSAQRGIDGKSITLVNPSVLNGCQTIKSANFFVQKWKSDHKDGSIPASWSQIPVSLRIVKTDNDELWKEVSESNNRQNAMSASALRANDKIQIELEHRFKDVKIFYERQESAYANIFKSSNSLIESEYSNTPKKPITIEVLAQAIVCATSLPLNYAVGPSLIFEQTKSYLKVFSERHLRNLRVLVFACNVRKIIDLSARDIIPDTRKFSGFNPNKFRNLLTRLTLFSLVTDYEAESLLDSYGQEFINRKGNAATSLKDVLKSILRKQKCPILKVVGDLYRQDENQDVTKPVWKSEKDAELLKQCMKELRLKCTDIFEALDASGLGGASR